MNILQKTSLWAFNHPRTARILIIFLNSTIAVLAWQTAIDLFAAGIKIPVAVYYAGIGLFLLCFACYPIRRARYRFWKPNYVRQKILDIGLILGYLMIVLTWTNVRAFQAYHHTEGAAQAEFIVLQSGKIAEEPAEEKVFSRKALRKEFKKYVRSQRQNGDKVDVRNLAGKILGFLALVAVLAVLSCAIACSGFNGLAAAVLIGGTFLMFVLVFGIFRQTKGKKKKRYRPSTD